MDITRRVGIALSIGAAAAACAPALRPRARPAAPPAAAPASPVLIGLDLATRPGLTCLSVWRCREDGTARWWFTAYDPHTAALALRAAGVGELARDLDSPMCWATRPRRRDLQIAVTAPGETVAAIMGPDGRPTMVVLPRPGLAAPA